jgi:hypothetical protein
MQRCTILCCHQRVGFDWGIARSDMLVAHWMVFLWTARTDCTGAYSPRKHWLRCMYRKAADCWCDLRWRKGEHLRCPCLIVGVNNIIMHFS